MKKVLVFGSFDILHPGHIDFFRQARQYGDVLCVVIARDKTIEEIKGNKPANDELKRKAIVEGCVLVDQVFLGNLDDPYRIILSIKPDVICLGYDQTAFIENLYQELKKYDFTPEIIRLEAFRPEMYKSSRFRTKF